MPHFTVDPCAIAMRLGRDATRWFLANEAHRTDGQSDSSFVSVSQQFVSETIERIRIQKMRVIIERVLKMGSGPISSFDAAFS
jgi:hypothetical protein